MAELWMQVKFPCLGPRQCLTPGPARSTARSWPPWPRSGSRLRSFCQLPQVLAHQAPRPPGAQPSSSLLGKAAGLASVHRALWS